MLKLVELLKIHDSGFQLGPLSIEAKEGSTVAIFGKNGAGKSTLFSIITGNADRTSGDVFWNQQKISPEAVGLKKKMGYLPQESDLPRWVTPREIVTWCAQLHQLRPSAVDQSLELWDALSWANKPLAACSHGMQKRIGLALATIHDPELLILDEAFNALDILHTRTLENLIKNRSQKRLTTLISTHTPLIAAGICSDAWIMESGKIQIINEWATSNLETRAQIVEKRFFDSSTNLESSKN